MVSALANQRRWVSLLLSFLTQNASCQSMSNAENGGSANIDASKN
jgi:hypothetical protein